MIEEEASIIQVLDVIKMSYVAVRSLQLLISHGKSVSCVRRKEIKLSGSHYMLFGVSGKDNLIGVHYSQQGCFCRNMLAVFIVEDKKLV